MFIEQYSTILNFMIHGSDHTRKDTQVPLTQI